MGSTSNIPHREHNFHEGKNIFALTVDEGTVLRRLAELTERGVGARTGRQSIVYRAISFAC
jgi:hypothetical protein